MRFFLGLLLAAGLVGCSPKTVAPPEPPRVELTVARAADGVKIQGARGTRRLECKGENVEVEGSSNRVTLTGKVGRLRVAGAANQVEVENAATVVVEGSGNSVVWSGTQPKVESTGVNNSVKPRP